MALPPSGLLESGLAYPALFVVGAIAGVMNTVAGGGSLVTLPLMIFLGLPATVANGTNRLGVAVQNVAAVWSFRRLGVRTGRLGPALLLPAAIGTAIGASLAVRVDERTFERVLGAALVLMAGLIAVDTERWVREPDGAEPPRAGPGLWCAFLALGVYGGFLQAGIGFFLMAALVWGAHLDLVRANAVKVWVVLGYTVLALAIFAWHGQVDLPVGATVAAGQAVGGWAGAQLTVKKGSRWVRGVLVAIVLVSAAHLLGAVELARRLL